MLRCPWPADRAGIDPPLNAGKVTRLRRVGQARADRIEVYIDAAGEDGRFVAEFHGFEPALPEATPRTLHKLVLVEVAKLA